ncbi:carboxypeptidase regulatory-like domain-containing protein [Actinoplanes sp. NEAU-H7]|uniref:Carboxypeptidase regulatory-like domain-containing protein n=1 Tax=Actinoplanes flavus TaxID=2820290 RepID=A0ABS3UZS8_9ACTN|nr:carboxypeptidase regulatory-like domain-containing protein [Actinoplanes flavus]
MTTHLRARTAQAGAFLALAAGLVAGVQSPALADPPEIQIQLSNTEVDSGSTVTMQYTVRNPGGEDQQGDNRASIKVSGMSCSGQCSPSGQPIQPDATANFNATLTAPTVSAGQQRSVTVTVTVDLNGERGTASETITVNGPAAPTTVRQVSGRIKDDGGARVSGVQVAIQDSAGHSYSTTTDGGGGYAFSSSDAKPIAAGPITVGAAKDGYESTTVRVEGTAGRTVNVPLTIKKVAAETTSPTPAASTSTSAAPEEEITEEEPNQTTAPLADQGLDNTSSTQEDGGSNWLLIIMGVLLVAAGIGAMVLVWMRRKNANDELGSDTGLGKAVPAAAGGFDATRVAAPVGGGRGGDATMIAPAGGMGAPRGGSLGDAPTMIHRPPVEDEFPDPYGAPMPAGGGFAGGGNQWGGDQGGAYGGATQTYGQQDGGYGAGGQGGYDGPGQGGYDQGQQQRYDEHTNLYQPEQPQRYDEHTNLYQPEPGGYPQQQGGYDQQGGYGDQAGWGGQDAGGYGPQGGYDQQQGGNYGGGYDQQQGGYPQQQGGAYGGGGYDDGGYDQQQGGNYGGGYDQQQQGGYGDQQRGTYGNPRPNRDWDGN